MKNILTIRKSVVLALTVMLALASCNDAQYDAIDSRIYIQETGARAFSSTKIAVRETAVTISVTPRSGKAVLQDTKVKVMVNTATLDEFNERNGTNYTTLPEGAYTLEDGNAVIKAGEVSANSVNIVVNPLSEELGKTGKTYALPVIVTSTTGEETLKGADAMVYVIDPLIITSVPVINNRNNLHMTMRQDYALATWSVEFRLSIDKLGKRTNDLNNQAMFGAFAPDGMDGEIYTRFGDASVVGNSLQVKNQGSQFNSNMLFDINTWYHIAFVNDGEKLTMYINGVKDSEMTTPGKITNLGKDKFQFGNTDYLKANVKVSEIRFWTKAISATQIQNNMFNIDPQTDGLEAYWRLNEGEGNEFEDYTGHGNICKSTGTTQWIHGVKADNKPDKDVEPSESN